MNHLVAPLELLLIPPSLNSEDLNSQNNDDSIDLIESKLSLPLTTIGIGDGGNEVGMGKIYETLIQSSIPNAQMIACTVPADHLIICSVSNWGGYALAAAIALVCSEAQSENNVRKSDESHQNNNNNETISGKQLLQKSLPTEEEQSESCKLLVAAGARDGITKLQELYIDGMTLEESLVVLREIRDIALRE